MAWAPAVIGRSDGRQSDEPPLAANLAGLPHSGRISRRHAQITLRDGRPAVECLADDPMLRRRGDSEYQLARRQPRSLQADDVIVFEFSQIRLHVLERPGPSNAPPHATQADGPPQV